MVASSSDTAPKAGAPEIEATPEMIEAGASFLLGSGLVWYREPRGVARELVRDIFETMIRLR